MMRSFGFLVALITLYDVSVTLHAYDSYGINQYEPQKPRNNYNQEPDGGISAAARGQTFYYKGQKYSNYAINNNNNKGAYVTNPYLATGYRQQQRATGIFNQPSKIRMSRNNRYYHDNGRSQAAGYKQEGNGAYINVNSGYRYYGQTAQTRRRQPPKYPGKYANVHTHFKSQKQLQRISANQNMNQQGGAPPCAMFVGTNLHNQLSDYQYDIMCKQFHKLQESMQHPPRRQLTEEQQRWYDSLGSFQMSTKMQKRLEKQQVPVTGITDNSHLNEHFIRSQQRQQQEIDQFMNAQNPNDKNRARHGDRDPVLRKEYRMMSDFERNRFHDALNQMKRKMVDGVSQFDILVINHFVNFSPGAHFGPAFLPFHREFVLRYVVGTGGIVCWCVLWLVYSLPTNTLCYVCKLINSLAP